MDLFPAACYIPVSTPSLNHQSPGTQGIFSKYIKTMDVGYFYYIFDFNYLMLARFNEANRLNERYVKFQPIEL